MAAALARVTSDDHIRHHLVDPSVLLEFGVLQEVPEETQEYSVFETFLFVPVPISFVFTKLAKGGLNNTEGNLLLDTVPMKDLFLYRLLDFSLHPVRKNIIQL